MNDIDSSPASESVTLVEVLEIIRPFEEFEAIARATLRRLEVEGVKALVRMQFYLRPGSTEVSAVITFSNRDQFYGAYQDDYPMERIQGILSYGQAR
jgi:hypothetical protein